MPAIFMPVLWVGGAAIVAGAVGTVPMGEIFVVQPKGGDFDVIGKIQLNGKLESGVQIKELKQCRRTAEA